MFMVTSQVRIFDLLPPLTRDQRCIDLYVDRKSETLAHAKVNGRPSVYSEICMGADVYM